MRVPLSQVRSWNRGCNWRSLHCDDVFDLLRSTNTCFWLNLAETFCRSWQSMLETLFHECDYQRGVAIWDAPQTSNLVKIAPNQIIQLDLSPHSFSSRCKRRQSLGRSCRSCAICASNAKFSIAGEPTWSMILANASASPDLALDTSTCTQESGNPWQRAGNSSYWADTAG